MNIKKIVASLIASRAITKGTKVMIKLGDQGVSYTVVSDGERLTIHINYHMEWNLHHPYLLEMQLKCIMNI